MLLNWMQIFQAAGVTAQDVVYFAFSFGPFLGFWTAFDAATRIGTLCIPGGGLGSVQRLHAIVEHKVNALCCTPTYALHLGEVAQAEDIDLSNSFVRVIIVAGEPGGSIPSIREKVRTLWGGARLFDHYGMTEVGPVAYEDPERSGNLKVIEERYFAEVISPESGLPVPKGETGELVLTTLGRAGSPLLRYKTGDLVKPIDADDGENATIFQGGILSRADDVVHVRGINLYPSAVG